MIKKHGAKKVNHIFFQLSLIQKLVAATVTILLLAVLASAIFCMIFSKPVGDDFGAIHFYRPEVWLANTWDSIQTTGRYGQTISGSIFYGLFGKNVSVFLPLITLFWFIGLIYLFIKTKAVKSLGIVKNQKIISIFATISIVSLVLFASANNNTDVGIYPTWLSYQFFFWPSGIVTYLVPLLTLTTVFYIVYVRPNHLKVYSKLSIIFISTLFAGVFNETMPATIIGISVGLLILSFINPIKKSLKNLRPSLIAVTASSFLAFAILLFSSGSQARQTATGAHARDVIQLASGVLRNIYVSIRQLMFQPSDIALFLAACLVFAIIIKIACQKEKLTKIAQTGIISGLIFAIALVGSLGCSYLLVNVGYGEHAGIITRTLLIPQLLYVLSMLLILTSAILFLTTKFDKKSTNIITVCILITFCVGLPKNIEKLGNQIESSRAYYTSWNEQEQSIANQIKTNPKSTIYLPNSASGIGTAQNLSCKTGWLYLQLQDYFGAEKICALSEKPTN